MKGDLAKPKRLIAVGDIHGQLKALRRLVKIVEPRAGDQFVFLGDYIDRGEDSIGVIDFLLAFRKRHHAIFIRGNHEQMILDFLDGIAFDWLNGSNGGLSVLKQYRSGYKAFPEAHEKFFRETKICWESGDFLFVHAGLRPGVGIEEQKSDDMLWIRWPFLDSDYLWPQVIVHGHSPADEPQLLHNRIGLDTAAAYGKKLTCCDVLTQNVWSVPVQVARQNRRGAE